MRGLGWNAWSVTLVASSVWGCALQPYALISTATHPGEYPRPATNADVPKDAVLLSTSAAGEACSHNVLGLVGWGDASVAAATRAAVASARSKAGDPTMLVDVKIDHRVMTILGVYGDFCTQVAGVAFK